MVPCMRWPHRSMTLCPSHMSVVHPSCRWRRSAVPIAPWNAVPSTSCHTCRLMLPVFHARIQSCPHRVSLATRVPLRIVQPTSLAICQIVCLPRNPCPGPDRLPTVVPLRPSRSVPYRSLATDHLVPFSVVEVSIAPVNWCIQTIHTGVFAGPCGGPVDTGCYPKAGICWTGIRFACSSFSVVQLSLCFYVFPNLQVCQFAIRTIVNIPTSGKSIVFSHCFFFFLCNEVQSYDEETNCKWTLMHKQRIVSVKLK